MILVPCIPGVVLLVIALRLISVANSPQLDGPEHDTEASVLYWIAHLALLAGASIIFTAPLTADWLERII